MSREKRTLKLSDLQIPSTDYPDQKVIERIADALEVKFSEIQFAPCYYSSSEASAWASGYGVALEDLKELLRIGQLTRISQ